MSSVFVSFATEDAYFVELLLCVLDFHGVRAWCSIRNIRPGSVFRQQIAGALDTAESMIVVVSRHAHASKWVTKEATIFMTKRPDARIIPIRLDDTDPNSIVDGLANFEYLDFAQDMRLGFVFLLEAFGKEFLARRENRKRSNRRASKERRQPDDRRQTPVITRMRKDFTDAFMDTGVHKFDDYELSARSWMKFEKSLQGEAKRYEYVDSAGNRLDPSHALSRAVRAVQEECQGHASIRAVYLPELVAEMLTTTFKVRYVDRRRGSQRTAEDRRDHDANSTPSQLRRPTSAEAQYKSPLFDDSVTRTPGKN